MGRKILIGVLAFAIVVFAGLFFWVRSVLTQDTVRTALAAQVSKYLGQPVAIGGISATVYPRVTVTLSEVAIGQPQRIRIQSLAVGTDFRALLSRRIEHAALRLSGARIELPLPELALTSSGAEPAEAEKGSPVEIVSVDEIVLQDVEISSGGRTLHGDVELVPQGKGVLLRRVTLGADDTTIDVTGQITDMAGPAGELSVKAGKLDFNRLLAFVSDFSGSAGPIAPGGSRPAAEPGKAPAAPSAMNVAVSLTADSATLGDLVLTKLNGKARVTGDAVSLDPASFGLFGGTYEGALTLTLGSTTGFTLNAAVSGVDMAAVTRFAGSPDAITGRLAGKIDLAGQGLEAGSVLKTARGTARVEITNGIVKNLGLIRNIILATSGRTGAAVESANVSRDEPFTRLSGTLAVAGGAARSENLRFESSDLLLNAAGTLRLDGSAVDMAGKVQLSDALSQKAGRDLVRYTREQGRVTLPVTIAGPVASLQVRVDVADVARRAVTNRATEEGQKVIKRGLGRLLGR